MKTIILSRILNIVLLVLLVVAAITTRTAYAACQTESGGGNLCGSAWLAFNAAAGSDQAWGNAARSPAPYETTIYVEGWTNCGGYDHRIGAAQNQVLGSTQTISASAGSGPRAGGCPDSQYHWNQSRAWSWAHNSTGQVLGQLYNVAHNNYKNW